jgi:hypothetical protein
MCSWHYAAARFAWAAFEARVRGEAGRTFFIIASAFAEVERDCIRERISEVKTDPERPSFSVASRHTATVGLGAPDRVWSRPREANFHPLDAPGRLPAG